MLSTILEAGLVAVAAVAWPAFAQNPVYKCGESRVYTDKPCDDAQLEHDTHGGTDPEVPRTRQIDRRGG